MTTTNRHNQFVCNFACNGETYWSELINRSLVIALQYITLLKYFCGSQRQTVKLVDLENTHAKSKGIVHVSQLLTLNINKLHILSLNTLTIPHYT